MIPGSWDFDIYQGSRFSVQLEWKDEDENLIDMTGYTWKMQIREFFNSTVPILTLSTTPGVGEGSIVIDGPGLLTVSIAASLTQALDFDRAVYDLEFTPPAGAEFKDKLLRGKVRFMREATVV